MISMTKTIASTLIALALFATAPLQARERVSIDLNGVKLNAVLQTADGKQMADGVILLTHGTLAHNEMEIIKTLQGLLVERGHNTLAINLSLGLSDRGSAMYDCKVPHKHRHEDAVDEIAAWVGWLTGKGAGDITVLGHSRGGGQTARYVADKLALSVKRAVLIAPSTWTRDKQLKGYEKNYKTPLPPLYEKAKKLVDAGKGDTMMEKIGFIYCPDTSASATAFASYYKNEPRFHSPTLLKEFKVPALVIAGADDKVVEGLIEAVEPLADGENKRLVIIDDADHFFRDFAAEEAADAIDEFVKPSQ